MKILFAVSVYMASISAFMSTKVAFTRILSKTDNSQHSSGLAIGATHPDTQSAPRVIAQEVNIFESILRDGEQGARLTFTPQDKGEIARSLEEDVGLKLIDAGLPGASPLDFAGVRSVVSSTRHATLSVVAHGTPSEIALASRSLRGAESRSRLSTFHRPMEISSRHAGNGLASGRIRKQLLKRASRAVKIAADLAPEVQYYLVYAGNRDPNFLAELAHVTSDAGATHIAIADSQSALTPSRAHHLTLGIKEAVINGTTIGIHCHNQMGLALPNTLAAVSAGATQVESCILGLGDAGGNLATEQFLAYCEHYQKPHIGEDEMFPPCFAGCSLPATTLLAQEVSRLTKFCIGENQPIVGERAFACTTGIHQDNLDHLGHATFQPKMAGREWSITLNRHSSMKSVRSLLRKHSHHSRANGDDGDEDLAHSVYSYLAYQREGLGEDAIFSFCDKMLEAYSVLHAGGILISPTPVGYTLITNKVGVKQMKSMKGRLDDKPCAIFGVNEIYKATFGSDPPLKCKISERYNLGHMGRPNVLSETQARDDIVPAFVPEDAIGPKGEVGIWLQNGPVVDYLATRLWSECRDVVLATSCNFAGEGNPRSPEYALSHLDERLRMTADLEIDIPHWEEPDLDPDGRWLSAPIWEIGTNNFFCQGRDQDAVSILLQSQDSMSRDRDANALID